jgi:SAM-dependent methyltransferase
MRRFRLEQLGSWISRNNLQNKKILEVGCGKGEYIDLLQKSGASQVVGLEFSENSITCAKNAGFIVQKGYLDASFKVPLQFQFDAFSIFSFLEHWPKPNEGLSILHLLLSEGASGLVEVPNFELILSKGLYSEFTTDHIFYFDKKSFTFLLEKNGFEVVSMESIWYDYILSAEVRKKSSLDVSHFLKIQNSVNSQLNQFIDRFEHNQVAIWGAGHQALAVIAMASIAPRIKYVIDSAPFKQGKYTPATHLQIFSPQILLRDLPKSIVIVAAGYSDEIANIILEKYPTIENIAILREDRLEIIR